MDWKNIWFLRAVKALPSQRLWRALNEPSDHPLYRRMQRELPPDDQRVVRVLEGVGGLLLVGLIFVVPMVAIPLLVIGANALLAARIGGALAREHASKTYDLLALLPEGAFFSAWMIAAGAYQRIYLTSFYQQFDDSFRQFNRFEQYGVGLLVVILLMFLPLSLLLVLLVWLFMLESQHLRLNALLFGIRFGGMVHRFEAQWFAALGFTLVQVVLYVGLIAGVLVIGTWTPRGADSVRIAVFITSAGAALTLIWLVLRELLLWIIWHNLSRSFGDDTPKITVS